MIEIPPKLEIQPKARRRSEELRQPERGAGCYASPAVDEFVNPLVGNHDRFGKISLGKPHGIEEFLQENFARVNWLSIRRHPHHCSISSVIVDHLDRLGTEIGPLEANTILIIDPEAILPRAFAFQSLEPITRRNPQIPKTFHGVQLLQLAQSDAEELWRQDPPCGTRILALEDILRRLVRKAPDHPYHDNRDAVL